MTWRLEPRPDITNAELATLLMTLYHGHEWSSWENIPEDIRRHFTETPDGD